MAKTPFTRAEYLKLIGKGKKRNQKKKKKKTKQIGGAHIKRKKGPSVKKHLHFLSLLTDPYSTANGRRTVLSDCLQNSNNGKLCAVKEVIQNINNIPIQRNLLTTFNKHKKELDKFVVGNKKEKLKILHKNCQKGGFLPLLGAVIPSLLKVFLG